MDLSHLNEHNDVASKEIIYVSIVAASSILYLQTQDTDGGILQLLKQINQEQVLGVYSLYCTKCFHTHSSYTLTISIHQYSIYVISIMHF